MSSDIILATRIPMAPNEDQISSQGMPLISSIYNQYLQKRSQEK
jgi:hypothetical protein